MKINAAQLKDRQTADALTAEASTLMAKADEAEREILRIVESKL